MKLKKKSGQMLVEIVMAVGVAVIALLAMAKIASRSVSLSGSAARQSQATSFARNAFDNARDIKASLGLAAVSDPRFGAGLHCFDGTDIASGTDAIGFCPIGTTEYEGRVNMTWQTINSKSELTVVSEVRWVEGNLTRTVRNEGKLVFGQ